MRYILIAASALLALSGSVASAQVNASSGGDGSLPSGAAGPAAQHDAGSGASSGVTGTAGTHANQNGGIDHGVGITVAPPSGAVASPTVGGSTGAVSGNGTGVRR